MNGVSISPAATAARSASVLPAQASGAGAKNDGGGIGGTISNIFSGRIGKALIFGALGAAAGAVVPVIPGGPIGGAIAGAVIGLLLG